LAGGACVCETCHPRARVQRIFRTDDVEWTWKPRAGNNVLLLCRTDRCLSCWVAQSLAGHGLAFNLRLCLSWCG
jgi:hypothetical protein